MVDRKKLGIWGFRQRSVRGEGVLDAMTKPLSTRRVKYAMGVSIITQD